MGCNGLEFFHGIKSWSESVVAVIVVVAVFALLLNVLEESVSVTGCFASISG